MNYGMMNDSEIIDEAKKVYKLAKDGLATAYETWSELRLILRTRGLNDEVWNIISR
jgi:hypothetical protein